MIVIPMAGNSRRFYEAGYTRPKYELPLGGESLFAKSVRSFEHYFATERFIIVCRADLGANEFVRNECERLGILRAEVVSLPGMTRGQAETVLLGMEECGYQNAESMVIFNIDTIRTGWRFPQACEFADGYLEVFRGEGEHWSFVEPAAAYTRRVCRTTEKERISELCSTGLYYFARAGDFAAACRQALTDIDRFRARWAEVYVAPLYNQLIADGKLVAYNCVDIEHVGFSGTPAEYQALLAETI
ncbi:MAG: hypothetical protein JWP96_1040 [Polaromonas sp.]|nr:hypothetical protein [Polaromonas sp.]